MRVCKELFSFIIYYPVCTSNFRETTTTATVTEAAAAASSHSPYSMHIIHSIMANWDYACCHFTLYFLPLVIWDAQNLLWGVCDMNALFASIAFYTVWKKEIFGVTFKRYTTQNTKRAYKLTNYLNGTIFDAQYWGKWPLKQKVNIIKFVLLKLNYISYLIL